MFAALASLSALAELARLSLQNKKPRRWCNSCPGHVENPLTRRTLNDMTLRFTDRGGNLHRDLPLFWFAASMADTRRLSYPERRARIYLPGRPDSTVRLYAQLAGFRTEG